jgi:hypothetical protein
LRRLLKALVFPQPAHQLGAGIVFLLSAEAGSAAAAAI